MEGVPRTPTSLDKTEEVRALNLEIAKLKSIQGVAEIAAKTAVEAADHAKARKDGMDASIAGLEATVGGLAADVRAFLEECKVTLQSVVAIMEDAAAKAKELAEHVDKLCAEIEELELKKKEIVDSMARENELISAKREDLDIYHQRILAASAKYLPGQKVQIFGEKT